MLAEHIRSKLNAIAGGLVCLTLAACDSLLVATPQGASVSDGRAFTSAGHDIASVTHVAVDRLLAGAPAVGRDVPLFVATFTDVQRIDTSTPFGHLIADQVRTRLAQQGRTVSEVRLRNSIRLHPDQGELVLARTARDLVPARTISAIVAGTYAVGQTTVFVSARLIAASDGRILSAVDFSMPRYPDADHLLRNPEPRSGERRTAPAR